MTIVLLLSLSWPFVDTAELAQPLQTTATCLLSPNLSSTTTPSKAPTNMHPRLALALANSQNEQATSVKDRYKSVPRKRSVRTLVSVTGGIVAFGGLLYEVSESLKEGVDGLFTGEEKPKRDQARVKVALAVGLTMFFDGICRKTRRVKIKSASLEPSFDLATQELGFAVRLRF